MDIIDIMLARAMTPQGQTDLYVSKANKAAAKAEKAEQDAAAAIATVNAAAEDIEAKQAAAEDLLETAQDALEAAQAAQLEIPTTEDIDAEVKKLDVSVNMVTGSGANTYQVITTYPDNTLHTENATKMYKSTGTNEDGTMTQKAITNALADKADASTAATKSYVDQQIANIPSGGGGNVTIHFTTDDAGHILAIDENGNVIASTITEENIVDSLISSSNYMARAAVGLDMDYANKVFTRTQQAVGLSMGSDFDQFLMYGGRIKCNVSDNGTINAFYGDNNYREDGSNGQVMIYQPKFYYKRTPYSLENTNKGKIIRHESLMLSASAQAGFKLAPIFEGDLDYVLLPAYDGSLDNNKLASVANATPLSNITISEAESLATARGDGWHIVNFAAESANQMLEIVEFGMMNGQIAIEQGITSNPSNGQSCYFITGSTSSLGNGTGAAESTNVVINGNTSTQTSVGYRAITYRGMENPWGNFWQMIAGVNIYGNGSSGGGSPYICTDYNYTPGTIGNNYEEVGFYLPTEYKWINAMGYGNTKYDWVFLPIECASGANSLLPVGDSIWSTRGLNAVNILASGGSYGYGEECGPFYYAVDRNASASSRPNYGAKLMFIPTKNSIYEANIAKWSSHVGG